MAELQTITELATELGITPRAIRFYEKKGLVSPQRVGRTRAYTRRDRGRLILVMRGKRLGFSLREIKDWLDLYDADPSHVTQARNAADRIERRIAALEQQRKDIGATLKELHEVLAQAKLYLEQHDRKSA